MLVKLRNKKTSNAPQKAVKDNLEILVEVPKPQVKQSTEVVMKVDEEIPIANPLPTKSFSWKNYVYAKDKVEEAMTAASELQNATQSLPLLSNNMPKDPLVVELILTFAAILKTHSSALPDLDTIVHRRTTRNLWLEFACGQAMEVSFNQFMPEFIRNVAKLNCCYSSWIVIA
jgi:hypothetical protein